MSWTPVEHSSKRRYAPPVTDRILVSPGELFGDGVFETIHLRPSGPWLLDEHLDRLSRSAALLDLPLPPRPSLASRVADAVSSASFSTEAAVRIICTRESVIVAVAPIPEATLRERRDGIRLISEGLGSALGRPTPWSLSGAKTLSYATNFAARRWARSRGADDLLWSSSEGYALEAPTASLVWLAGDELCTVPPEEAGILPGTTAAQLLAVARDAGLRPVRRLITVEELRHADGIWLASALRGLAEVISLDGEPRGASPWTRRLLGVLGYPAA
jgi:4-amino-4-deoxychorismate lyase